MPRFNVLIVLIMASLLLMPSLPAYTSSNSLSLTRFSPYNAFVDPLLLDPASYASPIYIDANEHFMEGYVSALNLALSKGERFKEGQVKVVITASPHVDLESVAAKTRGIIGAYRHPLFTLIEAWVTRDDVELLARTPGIYSIALYRSPLSWILREQEVTGRAEEGIVERETATGDVEPSMYKAVEVIGASRVWSEFGVTGKGTIVAVVDTGVDFGSPGLGSKAIARTPEGIPMILDSDQIGLTLTLVTSPRDENGFISIPERGVPFFDGSFLVSGTTDVGWVFYQSPTGRVYYVEFPLTRYHVGDIQSASGIYRFGLAIQYYAVYGTLYWSVPILFVDSKAPGVHDTVYADLSTMYYYLLVALNTTGVIRAPPESAVRELRDFSFADESPASFGNEVLARDFTGDGVNDLSIGALAGYLYDWTGFLTGVGTTYSWMTGFDYTGLILPGMDSGGLYVTIAYDYYGHGTSVANVIASRHEEPVDLGYGRFPLKGIAPDALIAANTGLINPFTAQFFFSGHDLEGPWEWVHTGNHKADIISNSWGSSFVLLLGFASSLSNYALLWDHLISTTKTVIVHAGGNGAPGYGTVTTPGDSAFAITLGASTLFDYRPYYGTLPGTWDDVVSWSARGPTNVGLVKPDLVNIGSFEWAFTHTLAGLGNGIQAITLFGGTSEATPMTSGSVALLVSYLKSEGESVDPGFVKTLLKSTARDLGYNAYVQGAGHVDIYGAFKALVEGGVPIVSSTSVAENLYALFGFNTIYYPVEPTVTDAQLYTGPVKPGTSKTLSFDITTFGDRKVDVKFSAVTFKVSRDGLVNYLDLDRGYAVVAGRIKPLGDVLVDVGSDHITFKLARGLSRLVIPVLPEAFTEADMVELVAYTDYSTFDPSGRAGRYVYFLYPGLELHYGVDVNNNGVFELSETQRINYDIRQANVLHLTVGRPLEKFKLAEEQASKWLGRDISELARAPLLDLRILASRYPADTQVTFHLELRKHYRVAWDWISFDKNSLTVEPGSKTSVDVTVNVPEDTLPGLYEGYVLVDYGDGVALVPVSVPVAAVISSETKYVELRGWQDFSFNNYAVEGQFDWGWRYESADWRSFPVIVEDPTLVGYLVMLTWNGHNTAMDIGVAGLGLTLLTAPSETLFYGAVYAAKLNWPPYYPSHGIQAIYDSPLPKMASLFAPDYGYVLERLGVISSRPPFWVVVKNVIADASKEAGFPEQFTLTMVPVRAEAPAMLQSEAGEKVETEVRVYGSYSLSGAYVIPFVAEGSAYISAAPGVLPIGDDHRLELELTASESSTVVVALVLRFMPQISIGYNMAGSRTILELMPGIIYIPINISVS